MFKKEKKAIYSADMHPGFILNQPFKLAELKQRYGQI